MQRRVRGCRCCLGVRCRPSPPPAMPCIAALLSSFFSSWCIAGEWPPAQRNPAQKMGVAGRRRRRPQPGGGQERRKTRRRCRHRSTRLSPTQTIPRTGAPWMRRNGVDPSTRAGSSAPRMHPPFRRGGRSRGVLRRRTGSPVFSILHLSLLPPPWKRRQQGRARRSGVKGDLLHPGRDGCPPPRSRCFTGRKKVCPCTIPYAYWK